MEPHNYLPERILGPRLLNHTLLEGAVQSHKLAEKQALYADWKPCKCLSRMLKDLHSSFVLLPMQFDFVRLIQATIERCFVPLRHT